MENTAKYRFELGRVYAYSESNHAYVYLCNYLQCGIKSGMSYRKKEHLANEYSNYIDSQSYDN